MDAHAKFLTIQIVHAVNKLYSLEQNYDNYTHRYQGLYWMLLLLLSQKGYAHKLVVAIASSHTHRESGLIRLGYIFYN